jgi:hypothetical protein
MKGHFERKRKKSKEREIKLSGICGWGNQGLK